jgi:alkyl hydroperoxide reductase subunit F
MYDLIIIGAGPAGISAAVYAARKKLDFLVITKDIGGQATWSGNVENYIGYQLISGADLVAKFEEHMRTYQIQIREQEEVASVTKKDEVITVETSKGRYESRTVVIAAGKRSKELGVPGEKEFRNKGLTYCATCDGPLFAGKDVAVIGGGNSALDAALQLVRIARHVTVVNINVALTADAVMQEKINSSPNATVRNDSRVTTIIGDKMVSGLTITTTNNKAEFIPAQGIFVEIGLVPSSEFIPDVARNRQGEIMVNCRSETSIPGIFAAGDVTDVPGKQIIIAAGEGAKATLTAFLYLLKKRF